MPLHERKDKLRLVNGPTTKKTDCNAPYNAEARSRETTMQPLTVKPPDTYDKNWEAYAQIVERKHKPSLRR